MKRIVHHPEDPIAGQRMFRSLGELQGTPGFQERLEREFPQGAAEMADEDDAAVTRRSFMRLMGASTAFAGLGLAACRRPVGKILPYAGSVEWMIPGKAVYFATAMPRLGGATPIIATIHEGRPTHLQGNPLHPNSNGGTDHFAIASILDLYDPERSRSYRHAGNTVSGEEFGAFFAEKKKELAAAKGEGLAILTGASTSPTRARLLAEIGQKMPMAKVFQYEAADRGGLEAAEAELFGDGKRLRYRFDKAHRVLSIGSDFLGTDLLGDNAIGEFSKGRKLEGDDKAEVMNRLYVLEHQFTTTGGMADHRLPVKASALPAAAAQIAAKVAEFTGDTGLGELAGAVSGEGQVPDAWVDAVARDLYDHKGESLVVAGSRLAPGVHALVAAMNAALTNVGSGKAVEVVDTGDRSGAGDITELATAIGEGSVKTLILTGDADPVYSAPADLGFGEKVGSVETVIHLGVRDLCATARAADWHVPAAHYLESWGDVRASDGTYSIVQPMIAPLFDGVSEIELFAGLLADAEAEADAGAAGLEAVKTTFAAIAGSAADTAWNTTLRNGFLKGSAFKAADAAADAAKSKSLVSSLPAAGEGIELVFTVDNKVWDGRYINNGWMQECPDPITSVVWDNAALVSLATLRDLGADLDGLLHVGKKAKETIDSPLLAVKVGEVTRYFPIIPAPGHAAGSVSISMGYGQVDAGSVAGSPQTKGTDLGHLTGFDVFPLRGTGSAYIETAAEISLVTEKVALRDGLEVDSYPLALTQEHYAMEGRALYRDGTLDDFEHGKDFQMMGMDTHIPPNQAVYFGQDLNPKTSKVSQWGLAIDLNQCIGCSACTIACQSENNIPIVGKDQILIGREMHWIRMDRYFAPPTFEDEAHPGHYHLPEDENHKVDYVAAMENPQLMPQPVACAQCEAAPCETVCPVNATVHTEDGLNSMAYNRCIGTRYCANNCPYKARRFNFFDYNRRPLDELYKGPLTTPDKTGSAPSLQLQKNPNVTVRMRGVMEKCTYCVQRIQEAKIAQKRVARDSDDTKVPTDKIKTACQQACPAEAITFGDLTDEKSMVNKVKASPRNYEMLLYLGLGSRTTYLARIKNPNKAVPGAEQIGTVAGKIH